MKTPRFTAINLAVIVAVILPFVVFFGYTPSYEWQQERMVKRVLGANPQQLLSAGRQLLEARPGYVGEISTSSAEIPAVIRKLKPTLISIRTNSVEVDFSDPANPFGIIIFAAGAEGRGRHKWIDGLWLYDDGQLEKFRLQSGSLKENLPVRVE
jgi:hypothetical protein